MSNHIYTLNKKHFEIFKHECTKWIKTFGLIDYEIYFSNLADEKNRGFCITNYLGKIGTINMSTEWDFGDVKLSDKQLIMEIRKVAFHEVVELLLAQFVHIAESRYCNEDEMEESRHRIIRTLENVIFGCVR